MCNNKTLDFINKSRNVHDNKYDYSKSIYINVRTKLVIICPIHGEFNQEPFSHVNMGYGCKRCGTDRARNKTALTREQFINQARDVHGNRYDYSLVDYVNVDTKIKIICDIHGIFEQSPYSHLSGCGCKFCAGIYAKNTDEFIKMSQKIHGNKYDYCEVFYRNTHTHVVIICITHGRFLQMPSNHLRGNGCPKCSGKVRRTTQEFILSSMIIHGDYYDYSETNYVNAKTTVKIICPLHGCFVQNPRVHLKGMGCPKCSKIVSKISQKWLDELDIHKENREIKIIANGCRYNVDGFDPITKTVYEYFGNFWHGNPEYYNENDFNPVNKKTYGELYQLTLDKIDNLKADGYNVIYKWGDRKDL